MVSQTRDVNKKGARSPPHAANDRSPLEVWLQRAVYQMVSSAYVIDICALHATNRGRPADSFARQVAMYLLHIVCRLSLTRVGELCHRDRTTVAHACQVVEDRRDNREFDFTIEVLEASARFYTERAGGPGIFTGARIVSDRIHSD